MSEDVPGERSGDDDTGPPADADLGAAVDDALEDEVKRQKARFIQQIMRLDRAEGVGRGNEIWEDDFDQDPGADPPST